MLITGYKNTHLVTELINEKCKSCGKTNTTYMSVYQNYFHVFWIPFVPTKKTAVTQCEHCKLLLEKKEFTPDLNSVYEALKSRFRMPGWTFSGLFITFCLIILIAINVRMNGNKYSQYIASPKPGDIYEVRVDKGIYTIYKVNKVTNEGVVVYVHEYEVEKLSRLYKLKAMGDSGFIQLDVEISKNELERMFNSHEIISIERNQ